MSASTPKNFVRSMKNRQKNKYPEGEDAIMKGNAAGEQDRSERVESMHASCFAISSLSLWLVDISKLLSRCFDLHRIELTDFDRYLEEELSLHEQGLTLIEVLNVNEATLELFAAHNKEELQAGLAHIFAGPSKDFLRLLVFNLLQGKKHFHFETKVTTLRGNVFFVKVFADLKDKDEAGLALFSITEITVQKKAEGVLQEFIERYRLLMGSMAGALVLVDADTGMIIDVNEQALLMFHRKKDELIGLSHLDLLHGDEKEHYENYFLQMLHDNQIYGRLESFIRQGENEKIPADIEMKVATIGSRRIVQFTIHDQSRILNTEKRRKLLATAVDQVAESVIITDTEGNIEYVNPAFEEISGYSLPEIIGKNPRILSSGQTPAFQLKLMWKEISSGNVWRGNFINKKKDGSIYREVATITPVKDSHGVIRNYVGVKRDITQQQLLEEQVRQSQKMQAIGTLAGGVAHDFNNILTAILGYAELSQVRCEKKSLLYENLGEIVRAADRAAQLVDQILKFSRQSEKSVASLRIGLIVKEVLKLLRASLPTNIEIVSDITSTAMVKADPTQMHQVIMNLCTNAYQALDGRGGLIELRLNTVRLSPREGVEIGNLKHGSYVCIQVKDNGIGIPPEYISRIFEPYFTTKNKQEGTGLGLSVVHGIVNDHAGAVTVVSIPGKGTCFTVYLPEAENNEEEKTTGTGKELATMTGTILVVDDEQPIVYFLEQVLAHLGYTVDAHVASTAALKAFEEKSEDYDLVITDMGMPVLTGLELMEKIKAVRPETPVILCTGYSQYVTVDNYRKMGLSGFITKPFNAESIAREVYRILEAKKNEK